MLYTLLGFLGIDAVIISYFANVSVFTWIICYMLSKRFKFCYVHRLPLYYILTNEIITTTDYYLNIPEDEFTPLILYGISSGFLILGYSYYYVEDNQKFNGIAH